MQCLFCLDWLIKDIKNFVSLNVEGSLFYCIGSLYLNDCWVSLILQNLENTRDGHRKFTPNSATANSAKLQEVFRNRKSGSL